MNQLMFLVNTRLGVQFVVHWCTRFNHNEKQSHCNVMKKIVHCLKETHEDGKDRGLTLNVDSMDELSKVECCADADLQIFGISCTTMIH